MRKRMGAEIIRKFRFMQYYLRPFRFSMFSHQIIQRLKSKLKITSGFRIIDLALTYRCNLKCRHCSALVLEAKRDVLNLDDYRNIAAQGRTMDNLSYNITGGEPLMVDWLDDLIPVLEPKRHYICIQTNCMLLSLKRAKQLAGLGVNCITTSLDSVDELEHNEFRGSGDSYRKVIEGIDNAHRAGMSVLVGGTVTHQNLRSQKLRSLIEKVNNLGAVFLFNIGVPCGNWKDNQNIMFKENDREYLLDLMDIYPVTSTDHEVNRNAIGCPAGKEKIYITAYGDVIPCPFIHVSFGNIRETSLDEIVLRMRKVPVFREYSNVCVAAEDKNFHNEVFKKIYNPILKEYPIIYKEIYGEL